MTDRYHSLTVVLEKNIRIDDAESTINAIKHIKGVLSVKGNVADANSDMAESRAISELSQKLWHILYPQKED